MLRKGVLITAVIMTFAGASAVTVAKSNLLVSQVTAQPTPTRPRQGWLQQLGLTQQQMQQIKQIRQQSKDKIKLQKQAAEKTKQEMQALMASSAPSKTVREKYNQLKSQRQQLADIQFENTLAIRELLNSEQRQKFADHMYRNSSKSTKKP